MKAHLVQLAIRWEQKKANFERVLGLLGGARVEPGDFVLLPEMFDTGFSMNTPATRDRGETLAFLREVSTRFGVVIQGGRTIQRDGAKAANVMTVVAPGGPAPGPDLRAGSSGLPGEAPRVLCEYQKIHPFSLGREHEHFAGGNEVKTFELQAGDSRLTVCPAICYDLRFPELFRRGLSMGAEMFALGACWPKSRQHHWRALLIARAIENQAFVLGVNRTGADPIGTNGAPGQALEYAGGSISVSPTGEVLGELGGEEAVLSVELDPHVVGRWREKFPAWKDRRL